MVKLSPIVGDVVRMASRVIANSLPSNWLEGVVVELEEWYAGRSMKIYVLVLCSVSRIYPGSFGLKFNYNNILSSNT